MKRLTYISAVLVIACVFTSALVACSSDNGNKPPKAYIDRIMPTNTDAGEAIAFSGHGIDSDGIIVGYEWRSSRDGVLSTLPSFKSSALSPGEHNIYFTVLDDNSLWSLAVNSTVTVGTKFAKPVIKSFTVSANNIVRGSPIELRWSVSGSKAAWIDNGIGQVAGNGARTIYPAANTTYTLSASNAEGIVSASASVAVEDTTFAGYPPVIRILQPNAWPFVNVQETAFTGNPVVRFTAQYLGGRSWQLNWTVSNSTHQVIEPDIGAVNAVGSTVVVTPSGQARTYRLTATNDWGGAYWQVIVQSP